jgi:hypothetical protein
MAASTHANIWAANPPSLTRQTRPRISIICNQILRLLVDPRFSGVELRF